MVNGKGNGKEPEAERALPPYIPFKTVTNFLQKLKDTVIPPRIDSSLLRSYPGSVARQLKASLKYMGLIDDAGNTTEGLTNLVQAYGTPQWKDELRDFIPIVYLPVIGDLDTDKATLGQLHQKFRDQGVADGQMLQKCVTFYLSALREAGLTVSPHFTERAPRRADRKPRSKKPESNPNGGDEEEVETPPQSNTIKFSFPVPDKPSATIILPADLATDDWAMIDSMIRAYVQRREKAK
jgi:hypothetical protein